MQLYAAGPNAPPTDKWSERIRRCVASFGVPRTVRALVIREKHMSEIGVTALDHAVQETNIWLKAIEKRLALTSRQHAYNALRAVLHVLRDRMPMAVAVNFGVQLP